jgi:hypothetical protein
MQARKSRSEWSAIIKAFGRSSMSHEEFCSERRLNLGTFRVWLYRLRRETSAPPAVTLLPIEVTPAAPPCLSTDVVIAVAGLELRVPIGADIQYVAGLVAELRSRC